MKIYPKIVVLLIILLPTPVTKSAKLLLIGSDHDPYAYRSLSILTRTAGFEPEYRTFYQVDNANGYQAIMFVVDLSFLQNLDKPLAQKALSFLRTFGQQPNKLLALLLPAITYNKNALAMIANIASTCSPAATRSKELTYSMLEACLGEPHHAGPTYDTALLPKKKINSALLRPVSFVDQTEDIVAMRLPINCYVSEQLLSAFPLGLYLRDKETDTHFFIGKNSLSFADKAENFTYNPIDTTLRMELLSAIHQLFAQLHIALTTDNINLSLLQQMCPPLPQELTPEYILEQKKVANETRQQQIDEQYQWMQDGPVACGWLDLDAYDEPELLHKGIKTILDARLNALWIRFLPEKYLSIRGLDANNQKAKNKFAERIDAFTQALADACASREITVPNIFVGMELTGNFKKAPVINPAASTWGTTLDKIPSPLDFEHFWKPELLDVMDRFVHLWQTVGNDLPLAGVFLDCEMYHQPAQASSFTNEMDYSDTAWHLYLNAKSVNDHTILHLPLDQRFTYLNKHRLIGDYITTLTDAAHSLGQTIKQHLNSLLPNSIIAAYSMTLPSSWFYTGFFAGLSSADHPLLLATFNNDCYSHYPWLTKNNIHLYHLPVILLSKFSKDGNDHQGILANLLPYHDGFWVNRFSRLHNPYNPDPRKWYFLEQTSVPEKTIAAIRKTIQMR